MSYGRVTAVWRERQGGEVKTTVAGNNTVVDLQVAFSDGFDPSGGTLEYAPSGDTFDYIASDADEETITLTQGLPTGTTFSQGDVLWVWPASEDSFASIQLDDVDEPPLRARVSQNTVRALTVGVRDPSDREPVEVLWDGYEWVVTDVGGASPTTVSSTFDPAQGLGYRLDDETQLFSNAQVMGTLGADTLTATSITMGTQDLQTDVIGPLAGGVVAFANVATGTATASIAATETILFEFNAGDLITNHVYYIMVHGHMQGTVGGDGFDFYLRYTADDTTPALTSGIIDGSVTRVNLPGSGAGTVSTAFAMHGIYFLPSLTPTPLRLALTLKRAVGTGTAFVYMNSADRSLQFWVFDMGQRDELPGAIIQRSGGTATGTPTATYTKVFTANDSYSFANTGDPAINDDGTYATQGYFSAYEGTQKSVVLFNDVAIRAALAGATVTKITATFRVRHAALNAGLNVHIRDHNSSAGSGGAIPLTYPGGSEIAFRDKSPEGAWVTVNLPVSFGTALKNGTARGYGFFAPSAERMYVGGMYGGLSTSPPKLTITYTK